MDESPQWYITESVLALVDEANGTEVRVRLTRGRFGLRSEPGVWSSDDIVLHVYERRSGVMTLQLKSESLKAYMFTDDEGVSIFTADTEQPAEHMYMMLLDRGSMTPTGLQMAIARIVVDVSPPAK